MSTIYLTLANSPPLLLLCLLLLLLIPTANSNNIVKDTKCKSCRDLTEDFSRAYIATSTNHFTGGDVAWEEMNLGKYSVSELRYYDIMDDVCGNNIPCLSLLEDCEHLLEVWWQHNKIDIKNGILQINIFNWLCIEKLEYCCHEGKFGSNCTECPNDELSNKICNHHGKCEGDGTRSGSGKCLCHHGYEGDTCGMCSNGFYKLNETCLACDESCLLKCADYGPNGCLEGCKIGYSWSASSGCLDNDECIEMNEICGEFEECINTVGSYKCECQNGFIRNEITSHCETPTESDKDSFKSEL